MDEVERPTLLLDERAATMLPRATDDIVGAMLESQGNINAIDDIKTHRLGDKTLVIITLNVPLPSDLDGISIATRYPQS